MTKPCILVMSGCFNPPTVGHLNLLAMSRNAVEDLGYSVVTALLVPTHGGYPKPGLASPAQRVEMCRLTAATTFWVSVEPHDTQQAEWCPVVTTLAFIQAGNPGIRLFFVCGADLVLRWNDPVWPPWQVREIVTKYGVIVAARAESVEEIVEKVPVLKDLEAGIVRIAENPMQEVSSTLVRGLVGKGKCVSGMVVQAVERYIEDEGLYKD
jgi:nicotinate (nicotinamide) nucleotide adenylyltransferase